jgi:hypothetical protein
MLDSTGLDQAGFRRDQLTHGTDCSICRRRGRERDAWAVGPTIYSSSSGRSSRHRPDNDAMCVCAHSAR